MIEKIKRQHAPGAPFPTAEELDAMSIGRIKSFDIKNPEQEALVQAALDKKRQTSQLEQPVYRGDFPDIKTKAQEIEYQKIVDERTASKRPQDRTQEKEIDLDDLDEVIPPGTEVIEHVVTQEDLDNNPGLESEVKVGDTVELEMAPGKTEAELEAEIADLEGKKAELTNVNE